MKRAAAKLDVMSTSRREEGERSGRVETALDRPQALLTRLTTRATNGQPPRRHNFRDIFFLFNLHYTKHGGHKFCLSEARFSLERFSSTQNITSEFETRITQQQQRLYKKIKNGPRTTLLFVRHSCHIAQSETM